MEKNNEHFKEGLKKLSKKNLEEALKLFDKAHKSDKENPVYMSYYGMASALKWNEIGLGIELCTKAVKKGYYMPELYVNLSKVYVAANNKKGALTVIKKGMAFDPDNKDLNNMLIELGYRKRPVIPFLKRSNFINKSLGIFFRRTMAGFFKKAD